MKLQSGGSSADNVLEGNDARALADVALDELIIGIVREAFEASDGDGGQQLAGYWRSLMICRRISSLRALSSGRVSRTKIVS